MWVLVGVAVGVTVTVGVAVGFDIGAVQPQVFASCAMGKSLLHADNTSAQVKQLFLIPLGSHPLSEHGGRGGQ